MLSSWRSGYSTRMFAGSLIVILFSFGASEVTWPADTDKTTKKKKPAASAPKAPAKAGIGREADARPRSCAGETPKIDKVQPDEGKRGMKVTILGRNFGPPGCVSIVSFGPGSPAKFVHKDDATVTAKKGLRLLTVTTGAGQDSKPFLVR